ncbi:MAG TPA: pentapeptide repeat-containing protein [Anaerolineae bacterium]|nr:pentapeptide repeat-containing protein [Anaerolineae bacterium]
MRHKITSSTDVQPPQLVGLTKVDDPTRLTLTDSSVYSQINAAGVDWSNQAAQALVLEQMHLTNAQFIQTKLPKAQLIDVRFNRCQLAGVNLEKAHLNRVEFVGCQLIGAKWPDAQWTDVRLIDCQVELSIFWAVKFKAVRFERCVLRQTSFENADLSGVVLRDCDLSEADFRNARLKGTDLRGSIINGVQVNAKDIAGAIITPAQAAVFVSLLGVEVKDLD